MGLQNTGGALASMVNADAQALWEVPQSWSLEEAATVPMVYATVLYALFVIGNMKDGQSILIHAGTGGIGQAAINVALFYKCEIFVTVGRKEKRKFIRKTFPQIPETHIGNSRDTSFEQMVLKETNGRGVDFVLNSLTEEKLQASVRCLAQNGKFLEIGKFDLASNNSLNLSTWNGKSFCGVMLDLCLSGDSSLNRLIYKLMREGLNTGMIKPLTRKVFNEDQVEQAFRYMTRGKHVGKLVIKLREEELERNALPTVRLYSGIPRFYANSNKSYVICGGLGGVGLELVDWLICRGVKKLMLLSRTGVTNGYQASRIRLWTSYGVTIEMSKIDVSKREGCVEAIRAANKLGPVEGIFNLAMVWNDGLLENQTIENFMLAMKPKVNITEQLDMVSREMCPKLVYFVVFSSVVSGQGNEGQTNYGLANSIAERICEKRKKDGYPGLAIQWGSIAEVGILANMYEVPTNALDVAGTVPQSVGSCLELMDMFLTQEEPVVSSIVVKRSNSGSKKVGSMVNAVMSIMGTQEYLVKIT